MSECNFKRYVWCIWIDKWICFVGGQTELGYIELLLGKCVDKIE